MTEYIMLAVFVGLLAVDVLWERVKRDDLEAARRHRDLMRELRRHDR